MSIKVWSWRQAITKAPIESNTKLVLFVLANYMNDCGGGCYPTVDQIAEDGGLSKRSVITHLDKAFKVGFITKTKHGFKGQRWANNEYEATMPKEFILGDEKEPGITPSNTPQIDPEKGSAEGSANPAISSCCTCEGGANNDIKVVQQLHSNSPLNSPIVLPPKPRRRNSYPEPFEEFWKLYPNRCEKPSAFSAWKEACKKTPPEQLTTSLNAYLKTKQVKDGFAPYPAKWLKNERWEEFSGPAVAAKKPVKPWEEWTV